MMAETLDQKTELETLKEKLPRGSMRVLATLLGCSPVKITDAFAGFIKDQDFLSRLQAEAQKMLNDKAVSNTGT